MNDWGGPQLLIGGRHDGRISRLAICSCEAFDNVPPKGAARALPYLARIPGGLELALLPFRFDRLRRLPLTYGPLSKRPVPREVMDRWFGPVAAQGLVRRDLRKYVLSSPQGRRDLLAASEALASFDRPALVAWAAEDRLMPLEHGRRLAELLPRGELAEIADSYTLIPRTNQPHSRGACASSWPDERPRGGRPRQPSSQDLSKARQAVPCAGRQVPYRQSRRAMTGR